MIKKTYRHAVIAFTAITTSTLTFNVPASVHDLVSFNGGSFNMGCSFDDDICDPDEGPKGGLKVNVKSFKIARYEVSVKEYRHCVEQGKCFVPYTNNRNKYCNYNAPDRDDHPLNCVNWKLAQNYCEVHGGRLPLEAEWELAARAGVNERYPWGHEKATCKHAIMDDEVTSGSVPNEHDGCGEDKTWPRGQRAANKAGLFDMQGGVAEWVYNWFKEDAIQALYQHGDLSGPESGQWRVIRGGAWDEQAWAQTNSNRWAKSPVKHRSIYGSNGFRCVFDSKNAPEVGSMKRLQLK